MSNNKLSGEFYIKSKSKVEKALLMHKQLKLDLDFDIQVSAFVPKANLKKPMPKVAVTIDCAFDKMRLVSGKPEDLRDMFGEIAFWINENLDKLNEVMEKEQNAWLEIQKRFIDSNRKQDKIISIKHKAG